MSHGALRFPHGGMTQQPLTRSIILIIALVERPCCVQSQAERSLQAEQCSLADSRAIRVKGFSKWPQLNRPFYDSRRVRWGRPVFSDITLSIAMFWGFWEWVPIVPDVPQAQSTAEMELLNMTNMSNASNASNITFIVRSPLLRGHGHMTHVHNWTNTSNFTGNMSNDTSEVKYHWVFRRNWAFGSFEEHKKEIPYVMASANSSFLFAANQTWFERARVKGSTPSILFPSVNCVTAKCFEAPREYCQERNREPCGGDESQTCGRCITGFAGEDGGSVWPCSKEGTAGYTLNFQEHLCNFLIFEGFAKQTGLNGLQVIRRAFPVAEKETWTSPETNSDGVAVYFCKKLDAWVVSRLEPKMKAGSFAEQIAEIGRGTECPYVAFFGLPHPSMPGGWTETYEIKRNITAGIEEDVGLVETLSARLTCHSIGDGEAPEWKGRCPTCTIMPTWWFCDGGCEALSLVGLILIFVFLVLLCAKCKLCMHMCWHVDEKERERQVKLGLMDCKDERAPQHMRIAKTSEQRVAVRVFGMAHPDHTIKKQQLDAFKAQNKQREEEKRAHEIEAQLKNSEKPPLAARLRWWARDTFAEPDTSRQKIHPLMCAPEGPEIRSPASSPHALALRDAADPDAYAPHERPAFLQRLDTSSWREPDKRHEALPARCKQNKDAALNAARFSSGPPREQKSAFARSSIGRRSSTLGDLHASHTGGLDARQSLQGLKALTNG